MNSDQNLPQWKHGTTTTEMVKMSEIDGLEQGAVLQFTDVGKNGRPSVSKVIKTCYGDLYVIVNALRDYANVLDSVVQERGLSGFQAATYQLHAERCRRIAGKYSAAIGYDYDKVLERCRRRRAKGERPNDTGLDGMEAFVRKNELRPQKKEIWKEEPAKT